MCAGVLASGGEDCKVCIWDLEKTAPAPTAAEAGVEKRGGRAIPQLVFTHAGHRASVRLVNTALAMLVVIHRCDCSARVCCVSEAAFLACRHTCWPQSCGAAYHIALTASCFGS